MGTGAQHRDRRSQRQYDPQTGQVEAARPAPPTSSASQRQQDFVKKLGRIAVRAHARRPDDRARHRRRADPEPPRRQRRSTAPRSTSSSGRSSVWRPGAPASSSRRCPWDGPATRDGQSVVLVKQPDADTVLARLRGDIAAARRRRPSSGNRRAAPLPCVRRRAGQGAQRLRCRRRGGQRRPGARQPGFVNGGIGNDSAAPSPRARSATPRATRPRLSCWRHRCPMPSSSRIRRCRGRRGARARARASRGSARRRRRTPATPAPDDHAGLARRRPATSRRAVARATRDGRVLALPMLHAMRGVSGSAVRAFGGRFAISLVLAVFVTTAARRAA